MNRHTGGSRLCTPHFASIEANIGSLCRDRPEIRFGGVEFGRDDFFFFIFCCRLLFHRVLCTRSNGFWWKRLLQFSRLRIVALTLFLIDVFAVLDLHVRSKVADMFFDFSDGIVE